MATPIAHKGVVAGAKVAGHDYSGYSDPRIGRQSLGLFRNVQTKVTKYQTFLRPDDKPAIWLIRKPWKSTGRSEGAVLRSVEVRYVPRPVGNQVTANGSSEAG